MRAVVQRVKRCEVRVGGESVGSIDRGLLVYLGVSDRDQESDARYVAGKVADLRVFEDTRGLMNLSAADLGLEMCVVSQFTLYGDARKGRRPSFSRAARPEHAVPLYELFVSLLNERGFDVACGTFGAHMEVDSVNDGPVTILIDSEKRF